MNGQEKFDWCLWQIIVPMFKCVFIDAANGRINNKYGYFALLTFFSASLGFSFYGIFATGVVT